MTPTQALKVLEPEETSIAALLNELIETPDKRPVIAPVTDRRKPWTGKDPESMFDALEGDE